jgi:hypothetical protein
MFNARAKPEGPIKMRKPVTKPKPAPTPTKRRSSGNDKQAARREMQMALLIGTLSHAAFSVQFSTIKQVVENDPRMIHTKAFGRWAKDNQRTLERISRLNGFESRVIVTFLGQGAGRKVPS